MTCEMCDQEAKMATLLTDLETLESGGLCKPCTDRIAVALKEQQASRLTRAEELLRQARARMQQRYPSMSYQRLRADIDAFLAENNA